MVPTQTTLLAKEHLFVFIGWCVWHWGRTLILV